MDAAESRPSDGSAAPSGPAPTRRRIHAPALSLLVFAAASMVAWLRLTPTTRATLWAEDGTLFLNDAIHRNQLTTIFRPYAGYLQLLPRLGADLVVDVASLSHFATAMTALSCLTAGLCASVVFVCSSALTPSVPARLGFAAITVTAPMLPIEVMGNLANIHSFFLWTAPWLLLHTPRSRRESAALAVFALVGALTEIQMLLVLPLALVDWRARLRWPVVGAVLAGETAQALTAVLSPRSTPGRATPAALDLVRGYFANVAYGVWQAGARVIHVVPARARTIELLAVVLVAAATVVSLRRGSARVRLAALAFPTLSVVVWALGTTFNRADSFPVASAHGAVYRLLRYGVVPSMFLLASLVLGIVTATGGRIVMRTIAATVALALVAAAVVGFQPKGTTRRNGPVLTRELARVKSTCAGRDGSEERLVPTAPRAWQITVSCAALRSGHAR